MDLLHEEKEWIEWGNLHVGAERRVHCEHMQALLTNILQRHWEWQEDRRTDLEPRLFTYKKGFHDKLGLKDGVRRGQALRGIEDLIDP